MSSAAKDKPQPAKESPTSEVEEDSEYTTSSSDEGGEGSSSRAALFGALRTRLRWDVDSRTLNLDVRQYVQNRRKLEVRYKGRLNTHNGDYAYTAQVQRIMSQNTPSLARIMAAEQGVTLEGEDDIQTDRFLPAGVKSLLFKDWTMAPGLRLTTQGRAPAAALTAAAQQPAAAAAAADSDAGALVPAGSSSSSNSSGGLRYCLTFRKQPQVLWRQGVWDSWLEGKADLELRGGAAAAAAGGDSDQQGVSEPRVVGFRGALRLKVLRLNVTDSQDLQLAVGADYVSSSSSGGRKTGDNSSSSIWGGTLTPYVKLSENSWAVRLSRGALAFTYEM